MASSALIAVTDACVLVPAALCDFLLRCASAWLFQLRWTDDILDEVRRTLVGDLGKSDAQAERRIDAMRRAFTDALVTAHRRLIGSMPEDVDVKDRHVVAAAVATGAPVIVTSNLRDFPAQALAPLGIEAQSPDAFLTDLFALEPEAVQAVVKRQAAALRNPPMTPREVIAALGRDAPTFAAHLSQAFQP